MKLLSPLTKIYTNWKDNRTSEINNLNKQIEDLQKSSASTSKTFASIPNPTATDFSVDTHTIQAYSFEDNYLRACINKRTNKVMAGGYIIEPNMDFTDAEADRQLEEFKEFEKIAGGNIFEEGENINLNRVLRNTCNSLAKGDDFFWELVLPHNFDGTPMIDQKPRSIHVLDWEDMSIKVETNGDLIDLRIEEGVRVDGPFKQMKDGQVRAIWDKWEIIHANYYGEGTSRLGNPLARSVLFATTNKRQAEMFSSSVFEKAKPRGLVEVNADDIEFEKIQRQWLEAADKPQSDIMISVTGNGDGNPVLRYSNLVSPKDLEFEKSITTSREDIPVGMGVPMGSIYAPASKSGWESQTELHEFDEDIDAIRDFLERIINNQLFPRFGWNAIKLSFSKTNKRDEEREAKISRLVSDIFSINERRKMLGKPEIEGGDQIIPTKSTTPSGSAGTEPTEEMAMSITTEPNNILYKTPMVPKIRSNYFRKTFSSDTSLEDFNLTKTDTRTNKIAIKPPIGEQQKITFDKVFNLRNQYTKIVNNAMDIFLDEVINKVVNNLDEFRKIKDPTDRLNEIDKTLEEIMPRITLELNSLINEGYDFGLDRADVHTGIILAKNTPIDTQAIEFLDNYNIQLVEGRFSDMALQTKSAIREGLLRGESTKQIASRIKGETVGSIQRTYKNRFENIARTEVSRAVSQGTVSGYEQSGVINKVEILIGDDPDGTCNKRFLNKTFNLNEARSLLPRHPRCVCAIIPIIE